MTKCGTISEKVMNFTHIRKYPWDHILKSRKLNGGEGVTCSHGTQFKFQLNVGMKYFQNHN